MSREKKSVPIPSPLPALLTISQAAAVMNTTTFAVRSLYRSGELKVCPIGHAFLISPQAIQDFIRKQEAQWGTQK